MRNTRLILLWCHHTASNFGRGSGLRYLRSGLRWNTRMRRWRGVRFELVKIGSFIFLFELKLAFSLQSFCALSLKLELLFSLFPLFLL